MDGFTKYGSFALFGLNFLQCSWFLFIFTLIKFILVMRTNHLHHRLFFGSLTKDGYPVFSEEELTHIFKACRHHSGDTIRFTDGNGKIYETTILRGKNQFTKATLVTEYSKPYPEILLVVGIIHHSERLSFLIEKAAELGVHAIYLLKADHAVRKNISIERLQRKAVSAIKQSANPFLPFIHIISLEELLNDKRTFFVVLSPDGKPFPSFLKEFTGNIPSPIGLIVGPEGGFSEKERTFFKRYPHVKISTNILRTETAAISGIALFSGLFQT